jgi:chemotaxis regulatin CheY-phosphate phosphatase CheZ
MYGLFTGKNLKMEPAESLKYPEWQKLLHEALLELDTDKLKQRVASAEAAIFKRLQAISQSTDHQAERQAIEDALASLRFLKRNSLDFPDWEKK